MLVTVEDERGAQLRDERGERSAPLLALLERARVESALLVVAGSKLVGATR
jgi:hypothetical protein